MQWIILIDLRNSEFCLVSLFLYLLHNPLRWEELRFSLATPSRVFCIPPLKCFSSTTGVQHCCLVHCFWITTENCKSGKITALSPERNQWTYITLCSVCTLTAIHISTIKHTLRALLDKGNINLTDEHELCSAINTPFLCPIFSLWFLKTKNCGTV